MSKHRDDAPRRRGLRPQERAGRSSGHGASVRHFDWTCQDSRFWIEIVHLNSERQFAYKCVMIFHERCSVIWSRGPRQLSTHWRSEFYHLFEKSKLTALVKRRWNQLLKKRLVKRLVSFRNTYFLSRLRQSNEQLLFFVPCYAEKGIRTKNLRGIWSSGGGGWGWFEVEREQVVGASQQSDREQDW